MKSTLPLAVALMASTAAFAQTGLTAKFREEGKVLKERIHQAPAADKSLRAASATPKFAPAKAVKGDMFFLPQEGVYYGDGQLTSGDYITVTYVPPFVPFKFINYSTRKDATKWNIQGEELEADENGDIDYTMSKGTSPYSLYYAPDLTASDSTYHVTDFVQPMDSMLYLLANVNPGKVTNYYYTDGSYFMTENIDFDFDDDGVAEQYTASGIRQMFEKPISPLYLHEILLPLYSTQLMPVPDGQSLTAVVRRLERDEEGYLTRTDTLAVMECVPEDIIQGNGGQKMGTSNYYYFNAYFASYIEDEFGTLTANPILLDDMFCIDILGFDRPGVEIFLFAGDLAEDPGLWTAERELPTYIVLNDMEGNQYPRTLSYYNRERGYAIEAEISLIGEMDGIDLEYNYQRAAVEGGETGEETESGDSPVYLFTNFPFFYVDGEEAEWSGNYDFEGLPEWAEVSIDPTYYDAVGYENYRGLHMVWFTVEPLPAGETGRYAVVDVVSLRGAKASQPIYVMQGDVDPSQFEGIRGVQFDKNGQFVKAYNLNGQAVDEAIAKGIIVKDGKKFFVK